MKTSHSIISEHVYRGKISGHVNSVTRLIYGAKFFNDKKSFDALVRLCADDIHASDFDAIVPVNTRDSKYNLPANMAKAISSILKIKFIDALFDHNKKCKSSVKNLRILVFDDVLYTGKTMKTAKNSVKSAGAKSITGFAIAKSKSFIIN